MNLTIGKKLLGGFLSVAALVLITGMLGLYYSKEVGHQGIEVGRHLAPQVEAALLIQLDATEAHLVFEEIMAGDTSEDIEEVWELIDAAIWYSEAIVSGGHDKETDLDILPTSNQEVAETMVAITASLKKFEDAAHSRYGQYTGSSGVGTEADITFDENYDKIQEGLAKIGRDQLKNGNTSVVYNVGRASFLFADGHLFLEEMLSGDDSNKIEDIVATFKDGRSVLREIGKEIGSSKTNYLVKLSTGFIDAAAMRADVAGNNASAGSAVETAFDDEYEHFIELANQAKVMILEDMEAGLENQEDLNSSASRWMIIISVLGVGLAVFLGFTISKAITGPVVALAAAAEAIAQGDLTIDDIKVDSKDEIGDLANSVNVMKANLGDLIKKVRDMAEHLASAMTELAASANQMATGSEEQSNQTAQVATSVEQMSATIIEVAKNSQNASGLAEKTKATADEGGNVVSDAIEGMKRVAETVKESAATVESLGKSSDKIGEIVSVINDIADQTNLLALNAAIEAARAGEQGRGFAVVADEVRKLAEKTSSATKEIAEMISNIQTETGGAMASMHTGTKQVEEGVELANKAGDSLGEIVASVEGVSELIQQIATASEEQSSAAEEISANVTAIASVSEQTAQGATQSKVAADDLNKISEELKSTVGSFKVN